MTETEALTITVDPRQPCEGETIGYVVLAAKSGAPDWEGADELYSGLDTAFKLVVACYVADEYGWDARTDDPADAPAATFEWRFAHSAWRLFENGESTGIRLRSLGVVGNVGML